MVSRLHNVTRQEFEALKQKAPDIILKAFSDYGDDIYQNLVTSQGLSRRRFSRKSRRDVVGDRVADHHLMKARIITAYPYTIGYNPRTKTVQPRYKYRGTVDESAELRDPYIMKPLYDAMLSLSMELNVLRIAKKISSEEGVERVYYSKRHRVGNTMETHDFEKNLKGNGARAFPPDFIGFVKGGRHYLVPFACALDPKRPVQAYELVQYGGHSKPSIIKPAPKDIKF